MAKKYDYIIVGAGIFGATCARLLTDAGKKCLIIERSASVGGLCSTSTVYDIDVHLYGVHDFFTENKDVWDFVTKYDTFNSGNYRVISTQKNKVYHLPITMNTFYELFGTMFPVEASKKVQDEVDRYKITQAQNFEDQCVLMFGHTAYNTLINPIYEKTYGKKCSELDKSLALDIPVRYVYTDLYHQSTYEGIPEHGYTKLIENMLGEDIDVLLNTDFLQNRDNYLKLASRIIYTGAVDNFCNYIFGALEWASFKIDIKDEGASTSNMFGVSEVETPEEPELIKIIEHKWLTPWRSSENFNNHNIISYLYKDTWDPSKYPMLPIRTTESLDRYNKYKQFVEERFQQVIFAGRNALYNPLNMAQSIELAMELCKELIKEQ